MASKSYRKFMATGLSAAVVASVVAPVAGAAAYDDVKEGAWYEEAINYVTEMEYMKGTGKGFEPGSDMTRAQAAQLFANILGLDGKGLKADFSDVKEGAWYYEAIAAVKEHGVMSGSGAKFNPNATLTRGEMAAIIVRAYDLKDHEGREHSFTDIEDNMFKTEIAILADLGIVDGVSAGKFAPKADVTRAQMASFIFKTEVPDVEFPAVKAVKAVDTKTVEVTVDGAWTQEDVDALVEAGYELTVEGKASHKVGKVTVKAAEASTSADTTTLVLSEIAPELVAGEALSLAVDGEKVEGSEFKYEAPATPEVKSVSAITAKSLKVTFAGKIEDTTKAAFEVKKGSVKVNTSDISWNEAKTEATIVLSGKLTAGEYTVNVSGLTEKVLTGSVTVQDEKVTKIEVLSTEAPLFDSATADDVLVDDLQVGYRVLNQYGEDITKSTSLTTSSNNVSVNPSTGTVTIEGDYNTTTNKLATFTLIHAATATTATATVTAVSESKVSEVAVKGLYNKDGKTLTETTNLNTDKFYVELELKDQYGKVITSTSMLDQILLTESNSNVIDLDSEATVEEVNGVKRVFVALSGDTKVGENIVTAIATATGKSASYKIEVAESTRAYNVDVVTPELTVEDEEVLIPVNVTDKAGNLITDLDILNDDNRGVKVTVGGNEVTENLIVKNGSVYLPHTFASKGYESVVIISNANQKVDTLTLEVKEAAKPVIITGVKSTWNKAIREGGSLTLAPSSLIVEDQYGRVMDSADFAATLGTSAGKFQVIVSEADEANTTAVAVADGAKLDASDDTISISGAHKGTEKVTVQLANHAGVAIAGTEFDFTVEVTDATTFKSFEFATIGKMYDELGAGDTADSKYDNEVAVYGVLDSGKKILLDSDEYSVKLSSFFGYDAETGALVLNSDAVPYADEDATEYTAKIDVVINSTGDKLTQNVTISKSAPKVTEFKLVNKTATEAGSDLDTQLEMANATAAASTITLGAGSTDFDINDLTIYRSLVALDSYGVYHLVANTSIENDGKADFGLINFAGAASELAAADLVVGTVDAPVDGDTDGADLSALKKSTSAELTIKPVKDAADSRFVIENNGTKFAAIASGLDAGDEFDVIISIDGVEKTFRVKK